jgi:nickel transport system substrate-binding protein
MFPTEKKPGTDGKMYESKELDPLIWAAARADEPDRVRKFQKVWDWLYENHAIAPLYHEARIWAYNNEKVKSFSIAPTEYEMPLEGLSFKH